MKIFVCLMCIIFFLFSGCKKEDTIKKVPMDVNTIDLKQISDLEVDKTNKVLKEVENDFINFYIGDNKFNFFTTTVFEINQKLGMYFENKVYARDREGNIEREQNIYKGFEIVYYLADGNLFNVIIYSDQVSVERRGSVGKTSIEIQEIYPEGFYQSNDELDNIKCYYVMVLNQTKERGTGYRFYFDENDKVESIVLSDWSFAP